MGTVIRSVTRFVPWHGLYDPPYVRRATISLVQWDTGYVSVQSPWFCLDGKADMTEEDLIRHLKESYATEEAYQAACRRAPFAGKPANEKIRTEIIDHRKWYGDLVGDFRVADKYGVSEGYILAVARGEKKAPKAAKEEAHG